MNPTQPDNQARELHRPANLSRRQYRLVEETVELMGLANSVFGDKPYPRGLDRCTERVSPLVLPNVSTLRGRCRSLAARFKAAIAEEPETDLGRAMAGGLKQGPLLIHESLAMLAALATFLRLRFNDDADVRRVFAGLGQPSRCQALHSCISLPKHRMYDWIAFDMTFTGKFKLELWGRRYQSVPGVQVQSPEAIYKHLSSVVVGQEAAKQALAMAAWRHQLYSNGDVDLPKSSVLLVGPTGCGKTLLASELARVMGVPFITFSATQLSANSYVGASVEDVLVRLLKKAGHRLEAAQRGVVFLDEIDKLRNVDSRFTRTGVDTKGTSVQQELLVPLEGGVIQLATRSNSDFPDFDTRGVLFILGGAFTGLDDIRRVRQGGPKGSLGFMPATRGEAVATQESATYQPADLVEYGFLPELAGRIGRIVELSALKEEDYYFILDRFPDGLLWPWYRLYAKAEVKLDWHSTALVAMAKSAAAKGMGARGLKSQLEDLLMPALYKARALTGSKKVVCVVPEGQGWTTTFSASRTRAVARSKGEARKRATRVAA